MKYIIILFAAATAVAGVIIAINPETIFGLLRRKMESIGMHVMAVVVRIILGVALVMAAAGSKYPTVIYILGWVSIAAAVILGMMGRTNFKRLMSWALGLAPSFGRMGGLVAILFGVFLIHALA